MNIAYHCSDQYAQMLGVSITSLFDNNRDIDNLHVYIISENMGEENRKRLDDLATAYHREITILPMPDINRQYSLGLKKVKSKWMFSSYSRLFLYDILPSSIDRVLFLDSDTLVLSSLDDLWNLEFGQKCFASVIDCLNPKYKRLFSIPAQVPYCNSRIILQNLEAIRKIDAATRIREYIESNNGYIFYMEQTVFNAVFSAMNITLPPKYNVYSMMKCLSYDELLIFRNPTPYYTEAEVEEARDHPTIAHLTTFFYVNNRAWIEGSNHPLRTTYKKYKELSPWKDVLDAKDGRTIRKRILDSLLSVLPRHFVIKTAGIIDRTLRIKAISYARYKNKK